MEIIALMWYLGQDSHMYYEGAVKEFTTIEECNAWRQQKAFFPPVDKDVLAEFYFCMELPKEG